MSRNGSSRGYIDPNFPPPGGPNDAPIIIYGYTPSFALSLFAITLFAVSLLTHLIQLLLHRTWYFSTLPIALILEIVGYTFRCFSAKKNPYNIMYFVLQYFFIVTAPVFLSAGIYAIFSILINRVGREYSVLKPKTVLWLFVTSDTLMTVAQVAGAALIGSSQSKGTDPAVGRNILLAGLAVQVVVFFVFLVLLGDFMRKSRLVLWGRKSERGFLVVFVAATLLVYLRTCFRLAEVGEGVNSYLFSHESFFIALEFMPIALAMVLFNVWHPGRYFGRAAKEASASGNPEDHHLADLNA